MSEEKKIVIVSRDVMAMMVPSGARIMIHEGTEVTVTQALGNSCTVNIFGNLARIEGKDLDSVGMQPHCPLDDLPETATLEDKIWTQLQQVYDPEIPVNIVDLGLIYNCKITPIDETHSRVDVDMTLTAPGCGMGPVIASDAQAKILAITDVAEAEIEIVFDPPWDRSMMSDVAKLELGIF